MAENSIPLTTSSIVKTVSIPVNAYFTNTTFETMQKFDSLRNAAEVELGQLLDAGYEIRYQTMVTIHDFSYWNFLLVGKHIEQRGGE